MTGVKKEVGISVTPSKERNEVVIQFDQQVGYVGLNPDSAIELAYALFEKAKVLKGEKPSRSNLILPSNVN